MKVRALVVLMALVGSFNLALLAQLEGSGTSEGSGISEGSATAVAVPAPVVVLTGLDPVSLVQSGLMSRRRSVPSGVPSVRNNSRPADRSNALKKRIWY